MSKIFLVQNATGADVLVQAKTAKAALETVINSQFKVERVDSRLLVELVKSGTPIIEAVDKADSE